MKKLKRISTITLKPGRLSDLKEFDWNSFCDKSNDIAVHCNTAEEAQDFCDQMDKHGLKWDNGESYVNNTSYNIYKCDSCYTNKGMVCSKEGIIYCYDYSPVVLEWSEYMQTSPKDMLELGYMVELRNGNWYIYLPYAKGHAFVKTFFNPVDLECYDCELYSKESKDLDVMKIYGHAKTLVDIWPSNLIDIWDSAPKGRTLLWERKEKLEIKMTVDEMKQKLEKILNAKIVEE